MKIRLYNFNIIFLVILFFSCKKEIKNPFISNDLENTLNIYLKEHENIKEVKMVQIEFRRWENKCSFIFSAYPKLDQSKKSFNYKGKMIIFLDEQGCSKGLINSTFVNEKTVFNVILKNQNLDTLKSMYPISTDFYHFDKNDKIQYSPKL